MFFFSNNRLLCQRISIEHPGWRIQGSLREAWTGLFWLCEGGGRLAARTTKKNVHQRPPLHKHFKRNAAPFTILSTPVLKNPVYALLVAQCLMLAQILILWAKENIQKHIHYIHIRKYLEILSPPNHLRYCISPLGCSYLNPDFKNKFWDIKKTLRPILHKQRPGGGRAGFNLFVQNLPTYKHVLVICQHLEEFRYSVSSPCNSSCMPFWVL